MVEYESDPLTHAELAGELGVEPVRADELLTDSQSSELWCIRDALTERFPERVFAHRRMVMVKDPDKGRMQVSTLRIVVRSNGVLDTLPPFVVSVADKLGYELARTRCVRPSQVAVHERDVREYGDEREYHVVSWGPEQTAVREEHRRPGRQNKKWPLSDRT